MEKSRCARGLRGWQLRKHNIPLVILFSPVGVYGSAANRNTRMEPERGDSSCRKKSPLPRKFVSMKTLENPLPLRPNHKSGPRDSFPRFGFTTKRTLFAILHFFFPPLSSFHFSSFVLFPLFLPPFLLNIAAHDETKFGFTVHSMISIAHDDPLVSWNRFDWSWSREGEKGISERDKMSGV